MATTIPTSAGDFAACEAVEVVRQSGRGRFILVCEHASNAIPASLGNLGLSPEALDSHIAWDPGALAVARHMSRLLDAPLVAGRLSRLVYDCNRPPEAPDAISNRSERHVVPGNANLDDADREARIAHVYEPFRNALTGCLDAHPCPPVLLTVHSFTPVYHGARRDVELGVLHDVDNRFADALLAQAEAEADLVVRRNAPYGPDDGVTHTLFEHGIRLGLLNAMLEIRNDLIAELPAQKAMAERLSRYACDALEAMARAATKERVCRQPS